MPKLWASAMIAREMVASLASAGMPSMKLLSILSLLTGKALSYSRACPGCVMATDSVISMSSHWACAPVRASAARTFFGRSRWRNYWADTLMATRKGVPAQQGLCAHDDTTHHVDLWLVMQLQNPIDQGFFQAGMQLRVFMHMQFHFL
jgi:hypothetical protein